MTKSPNIGLTEEDIDNIWAINDHRRSKDMQTLFLQNLTPQFRRDFSAQKNRGSQTDFSTWGQVYKHRIILT